MEVRGVEAYLLCLMSDYSVDCIHYREILVIIITQTAAIALEPLTTQMTGGKWWTGACLTTQTP